MGKAFRYLTLDTETATLPFANEIAKNAKEKKLIAIAKPLIYDIGWTIHNRKGEILEERQFLIAEIFSVPEIFNTAYYREKRPIYLNLLKSGETSIKTWSEVTDILIADIKTVNFVCAFNARFDFKKAIPFTDLYIKYLYSEDYFQWERAQKDHCLAITNGIRYQKEGEETRFQKENFCFRGDAYKMIDLWAVACETLINNGLYKIACLEERMISASGEYFKTSAESTYRYLLKRYSFIEAHTALEDARIESYILGRAAKRKKPKIGITDFPFRKLGTTVQFLEERKRGLKPRYFEAVISQMEERLREEEQKEKKSNWAVGLERRKEYLKALYLEKFSEEEEDF